MSVSRHRALAVAVRGFSSETKKNTPDPTWEAARTAILTQGAPRALPEVQTVPLKSFGNVLGGNEASLAVKGTFVAWHLAVHDAKVDSLERFLAGRVAEQCTFHPPTYFPPWKGRREFLMLVTAAGEVFGDSFEYSRQWLSEDGREWALEFSAEIGATGKRIEGIDLVSLDDHGVIQEFKVLARPPNAVSALKDAMMLKVPPRLAMLYLTK